MGNEELLILSRAGSFPGFFSLSPLPAFQKSFNVPAGWLRDSLGSPSCHFPLTVGFRGCQTKIAAAKT